MGWHFSGGAFSACTQRPERRFQAEAMALGQQHKELGEAGVWEQRETEGYRQRMIRWVGPSLAAYWGLGAAWVPGIVKLQENPMGARIVRVWQAMVQSLNLALLRY